mgnify:FL=1
METDFKIDSYKMPTSGCPYVRTQEKLKVMKDGKTLNAVAASNSNGRTGGLDVIVDGKKHLCIWNEMNKGWIVKN